MKKQRFRLGSVLKHYELQKQRADFDLQRALRTLGEIDEEIANLNAEVAALAGFVRRNADGSLSAAGWMACCRKSEYLGRQLETGRWRRARQAEAVAKCNETRKRWAIAEETLLLLRRGVETANQSAEAHATQLQLQEMILRRALGHEVDDA